MGYYNTYIANEESRREAPSIIIHDTSDPPNEQYERTKGREAAFVSEFLSRSDRDRRARNYNDSLLRYYVIIILQN